MKIMESTVPVVRFVKCPKCHKILTEFAEVPVYKCGGCGAILRAKKHSSSEQNSSTDSVSTASQNLPDLDHLSNESVNREMNTNLNVSDSSGENISIEKALEHEQNDIYNAPNLEGPGKLEQSLKVNPEANDSLKSSIKLNESSETMSHSTTSEDGMIKMEFANENRFNMNHRKPSHAYDLSASSTDEDRKNHIPRKFLMSRRTYRNKYVSDSVDSTETGENSIPDVQDREKDYTFASLAPFRSSSSPTTDDQVKFNHRFSEQEKDQVKILNKVDELRKELRGLFNETANVKGFKGKVPQNEDRSSLIPFSRYPNSHVCCHLSETVTHPLHIQSNTINHGPPDVQHKASRSQPMLRLCRPVSGGAPFVICFQCFRLLQIPADFLVSPKKVHKLRCGACMQVLLFSFRPRSHSIPQTPEEFQHPPSKKNENLMSRFEAGTDWDPISTSEDSFFSLDKSYSSEAEPSLNNSRSFDEIVEENQGEGGDKIGSRLHDLLGYTSARELLFNTDYSFDGHQSTDSDSPGFYQPFGRRRWERR